MSALLRRHRRTLVLLAVLVPLALLLTYVVLRSGPLAPVAVTVAEVQHKALAPALFGVGTVEAQATHRIGPTAAGRVQRVAVQIGDSVQAGQVVAEIDPIDLEDRIAAQEAALRRAEASAQAAAAQVQETAARRQFAQSQLRRYEQLVAIQFTSQEALAVRQQDVDASSAAARGAVANQDAARQEMQRLAAERQALLRQRQSLRLTTPVAGVVTARGADPGSTVVAGQSVVEVVAHGALWVHTRFDQQRAQGLVSGLAAQVVLRTLGPSPLPARVVRIEPRADAVTEELLAKVQLQGSHTPPIGELAEVTVALPAQAARPVVASASVQRVGGQIGVWLVGADGLQFQPVTLGVQSLEGEFQVLAGLRGGEKVVVYSQRALDRNSRILVVERLVAPSGART